MSTGQGPMMLFSQRVKQGWHIPLVDKRMGDCVILLMHVTLSAVVVSRT